MRRRSSAAAAAVLGAIAIGPGRLGRFLRSIDRRAGLFAPRGARLHDAIAPRLLRPLYRRAAADVAALSVDHAPPISAVLEIGSGPGHVAIEISRSVPEGAVLGVDLAATTIERARQPTHLAGADGRVQVLLADAARLPITDGACDVVVSTLSLHHWADPGAVFAELGRVLRPRGVALIYDLRPFAYLRHELEVFLVGTPFEGSRLDWDLVPMGPLPAAFVRIRLVRPEP